VTSEIAEKIAHQLWTRRKTLIHRTSKISMNLIHQCRSSSNIVPKIAVRTDQPIETT